MENSQEPRDENLLRMAKRRVEFKKHLFTYIIVNIFLWGIWLFGGIRHDHLSFPWPAFVSLGWGIGLTFNYIRAYTGFKDNMVEREYQKLVNNQNDGLCFRGIFAGY
jgi:hypothetical protein